MALVITQLVAGAVNLWLHAPVWLQIAHLLLSDLIWLVLILLAVSSLAQLPDKQAVAALEVPAAA